MTLAGGISTSKAFFCLFFIPRHFQVYIIKIIFEINWNNLILNSYKGISNYDFCSKKRFIITLSFLFEFVKVYVIQNTFSLTGSISKQLEADHSVAVVLC